MITKASVSDSFWKGCFCPLGYSALLTLPVAINRRCVHVQFDGAAYRGMINVQVFRYLSIAELKAVSLIHHTPAQIFTIRRCSLWLT